MFLSVEIAGLFDKIALSVDGVEYELCKIQTAECLVINAILEQLKVSTSKYVYAKHNGDLIFLKEVNSNLEEIDDTIRFNLPKNTVLNGNDFFLVNSFLNTSSLSNSSCSCFVRWGKKVELFFDVEKGQNNHKDYTQWITSKLAGIGQVDILEKRFNVLLNKTFLDKLKTYYQFWKQEQQSNEELPSWFNRLYSF